MIYTYIFRHFLFQCSVSNLLFIWPYEPWYFFIFSILSGKAESYSRNKVYFDPTLCKLCSLYSTISIPFVTLGVYFFIIVHMKISTYNDTLLQQILNMMLSSYRLIIELISGVYRSIFPFLHASHQSIGAKIFELLSIAHKIRNGQA